MVLNIDPDHVDGWRLLRLIADNTIITFIHYHHHFDVLCDARIHLSFTDNVKAIIAGDKFSSPKLQSLATKSLRILPSSFTNNATILISIV